MAFDTTCQANGPALLPAPSIIASGLRGLPNLLILRLMGWPDIDDLFLAFDSRVTSSFESDEHPILCPSLIELVLDNSYFIDDSLIAPDETDSTLSLLSRRKHNLEVPFGRLPDDVLREIACHYVDLWRGMERLSKSFDWRNILAVNCRLRSVLIETPILWTTIGLDWLPEIRDLFHSRAKGFPLHIRTDEYVGPKEHQRQSAGDFICQNIDVISSLVVSWHPAIETDDPVMLLRQLFSERIGNTPFPQLKHASFFHEVDDVVMTFGTTITIHAPQLESLVLDTMVLNPTTLSPFPRLTSIKIREVMTCADEVIPLLAACPALQFCSIDTDADGACEFIDVKRWRNKIPKITTLELPALKALSIEALDWREVNRIFRILQHSPKANMTFQITGEGEDDNIAHVIPRLFKHQITHYNQIFMAHTWCKSKYGLCSTEGGSIALGFEQFETSGEERDPFDLLFSALSSGFANNISCLHLHNANLNEFEGDGYGDKRSGVALLPMPSIIASGLRSLPTVTSISHAPPLRRPLAASLNALFLAR
ncbi:hypothetical protein SISNIDRAFT_487386 [Sistotremastrum niveocremeum HHB9708]|uniref:F-box domain-containing protein n=1 Tax=Sistotremastrum niveocremeum HHB9708 TaxID=1314777 RepID=A0A164SEI1_9AGAM|nr:hypothetical protein SISNIDRAFT_487386 [Sistotremastrum niveocremeum HHB9708]